MSTLQIPDHLTCPIGLELLNDPVICDDGYTYERENLLALPELISPMTRQPINKSILIPNRAIADAVAEFLKNKQKQDHKKIDVLLYITKFSNTTKNVITKIIKNAIITTNAIIPTATFIIKNATITPNAIMPTATFIIKNVIKNATITTNAIIPTATFIIKNVIIPTASFVIKNATIATNAIIPTATFIIKNVIINESIIINFLKNKYEKNHKNIKTEHQIKNEPQMQSYQHIHT